MSKYFDRRNEALQKLINAEQDLVQACSQPDTGTGRRIRDIVWSCYGDAHRVNLCESLSCLDSRMAEAAFAAIRGRAILGGDCEEVLGRILESSGELSRWDKEEREERRTPMGMPVVYPKNP